MLFKFTWPACIMSDEGQKSGDASRTFQRHKGAEVGSLARQSAWETSLFSPVFPNKQSISDYANTVTSGKAHHVSSASSCTSEVSFFNHLADTCSIPFAYLVRPMLIYWLEQITSTFISAKSRTDRALLFQGYYTAQGALLSSQCLWEAGYLT